MGYFFGMVALRHKTNIQHPDDAADLAQKETNSSFFFFKKHRNVVQQSNILLDTQRAVQPS